MSLSSQGLTGQLVPDAEELCVLQLLACIGEQFDEGDEICGIVVNLRARQDRLCVWTKTAHNEAAQVTQAVSAKLIISRMISVPVSLQRH